MESMEKMNTKAAEQAPCYGTWLEEKIRAEAQDFSKLSEFERFVLNSGYRFDTKEGLKAGFDRRQKTNDGIMLTEEEFAAECRPCFIREADYTPPAAVSEVYKILIRLVEEEKLTPGDVFLYAANRWCLNEPEAIIAYQVDPYSDSPIHRKWAVNNCARKIENEEARIKICEEFGFEASRIRIIGTPYYESTD